MTYVTSDISLAAFLFMSGMTIISAKKAGGKFEFTFDDNSNVALQLSQSYIISEHPKFDAAMRQLKRMLYGQQ
jgi:hypothetical protein